jgi:hypothetical protein
VITPEKWRLVIQLLRDEAEQKGENLTSMRC